MIDFFPGSFFKLSEHVFTTTASCGIPPAVVLLDFARPATVATVSLCWIRRAESRRCQSMRPILAMLASKKYLFEGVGAQRDIYSQRSFATKRGMWTPVLESHQQYRYTNH